MRYIDSYELREWVKERLTKSIFQKAHALAVQTGIEILVKLEDVTDVSGPQYYATRNLQQAYRHGGVCEKPGERCVSGDTGLPTVRTAEIAIQSCSDESLIREPVFGIRNRMNDNSIKLSRTSPTALPSQIHTSHKAPQMMQQHQHRTNKVARQAAHEQQNPNIESNDHQSTVSDAQRTHGDVNMPVEPATDTPMTIKMEVHDVNDDDDDDDDDDVKEDTDLSYLDQSEMVNNGNDDMMAPLSKEEEDFYDDHFGNSRDFDDSGSQSGSQSGMIPHQSGEMGSPVQSQQAMSGAASSSTAGASSYYVAARKSTAKKHKFARVKAPPKPVDFQSLTTDTVATMLTYPVTLPTFSSHVQYSLENGHIHSGKMWSQFCKESCQFYQPLMDIYDNSPFSDSKTSSVVYQSIGRTMYEKYPCIAGKGIRPWTLFNKWLSTKIRQQRFQLKKKEEDLAKLVNVPNS